MFTGQLIAKSIHFTLIYVAFYISLVVKRDVLPTLPCSDFLKCSQHLFQGWRIALCSLTLPKLMSPLNCDQGPGNPAITDGSKRLLMTLQICFVEGSSPAFFVNVSV